MGNGKGTSRRKRGRKGKGKEKSELDGEDDDRDEISGQSAEKDPTTSTLTATAEPEKPEKMTMAHMRELVHLMQSLDKAYQDAQDFHEATFLSAPSFHFVHYAEKVLSLHSAAKFLVRFGENSTWSHILQRTLHIKPVDPQSTTLVAPTDLKDFVLKHINVPDSEKDETFETNLDQAVAAALKFGLKFDGKEGHAHCECLIMAEHLRNIHFPHPVVEEDTATSTRPFRYIGCSKLSCYSCNELFEATTGTEFPFVGLGLGGKFYGPWSNPRGMPSTVMKKFKEEIISAIISYLKESSNKRLSIQSDSTSWSINPLLALGAPLHDDDL
ncbi:hypothetical protein BD410DRAFT_791170 [Rickenella mellea]|uniref:Uncharacterized protein n=1 Tax=Rickenella mellea TaxID=50990 RepID=A0A4Y7PZ67_9AGAM|nr:hypothetical protein BD410DRAFT_791170 [Rickenella mellea]